MNDQAPPFAGSAGHKFLHKFFEALEALFQPKRLK